MGKVLRAVADYIHSYGQKWCKYDWTTWPWCISMQI